MSSMPPSLTTGSLGGDPSRPGRGWSSVPWESKTNWTDLSANAAPRRLDPKGGTARSAWPLRPWPRSVDAEQLSVRPQRRDPRRVAARPTLRPGPERRRAAELRVEDAGDLAPALELQLAEPGCPVALATPPLRAVVTSVNGPDPVRLRGFRCQWSSFPVRTQLRRGRPPPRVPVGGSGEVARASCAPARSPAHPQDQPSRSWSVS